MHSVKSFNTEVKQGLRDPLSADELADMPISKPGDAIDDDKNDEKKEKSHGETRDVRQAKIVRPADSIDPISGKARGKVMESWNCINIRMQFLRWTNNNPKVGELFSGVWWKEKLC